MTSIVRSDGAVEMREAVWVPTPSPLAPAPLDLGETRGTIGRIEVTTRCLVRDGTPWIPVMGEYHFSRDRPENWERELRKMRAGGVDVVATYLIWILHEETRGELRWDAGLDVRRFVETAHRVGLTVVLRIGPWVHGETRNGGFPDWLQQLSVAHRTDDPAYLDHARRWIAAISEQTRGLFRGPESPDGPVIGIQLENELYDQPGHLATLRRMCEDVGMRVPLWTATGWGGAQLPARTVLPVYAGYSDGFWEESDVEWPAFGIMHFTFNARRDDLTVGADVRGQPAVVDDDAALGVGDPWLYATCELGGGMTVAYHRRPHVDPEDVAALALTKLGSGSSWQGYYLYHGATHRIGALSTTQESHATGYPNDVPVLDYDFYAPIGAHGQQRPHFHRLRRQHLFLQSFGASLAPLPAVVPEQRAGGPRWAVRHDGERGYLFFNNHQPAVEALPALVDVGFTVEGVDRTVTIPACTADIPAGATAIWPLRQPCGAIPALTATAQLVTRIAHGDRTVVVLAATDGIDVELQVEGVPESDITGAGVESYGDLLLARPNREPGPDCVVTVGDTDLVILTAAQADSVWRGEIRGRDTVVLWDGDAWFDDEGFRVVPNHRSDTLLALPRLTAPATGTAGPFVRHDVPSAPPAHDVPLPDQLAPRMAPVRADEASLRRSAPTDEDFAALDAVDIGLDDAWFDDVEQLILSVEWFGDAMRVYAGDQLVADQFFSGRRLELDLVPHREAIRARGLRLKAFAWRADDGIHIDRRFRAASQRPVLELRSVEARPVVTATLT